MSDGDAGRTRTPNREDDEEGDRGEGEGERGSGAGAAGGSERGASKSRDENGFSFALPPISLPQVRFPERIRLFFPVPEPPEKASRPTRIRVSWVVLVALVVDVLDAAVVLWTGPDTLPWARAAVGVLASTLFAGPAGLVYAWELLVTLFGVGWLALFPTAAVLLLARMALSG